VFYVSGDIVTKFLNITYKNSRIKVSIILAFRAELKIPFSEKTIRLREWKTVKGF